MKKLLLILKTKFKKENFKKIFNLLLIIFSFGILAFFFLQDDNWIKFISAIPKLNLKWILLGIISIFMSWYFESLSILEIIMLIERRKIKKMSAYKVTLIGQYFSSITPMGIGSPPAQTAELKKINIQKNSAATIIATKFIIYQSLLTIYSIICAIIYISYNHNNQKFQLFIQYLLIGLIFQNLLVIVVFLFIFLRKNIKKIKKSILKSVCKIKIFVKNKNKIIALKNSINLFADSMLNIIKNKSVLVKLVIYNFLQISLLFAIPFFIFKAFNHNSFPALEMIQTQCISNTICSFTPLPGNAGASENTFLTLFGEFFLSSEIIVAMIIHRAITFYLNIIIGSIVYSMSNKKART